MTDPKITIQLDTEDARVMVACIGMALGVLTSPTAPILVMTDAKLAALYRSLLMIMSRNATGAEVQAKIREGRLDEMLKQTDVKILQLADLMHTLLRQTDPEEMADTPDLPSTRARGTKL